MKIGIMGGTFNPIHYGHLVLSEYVLDALNLDYVIFIPTGNPPHKDGKDIIDANDRKNMVEIAIKANSKFKLSSMEIDRLETTYTIDTIKELKNKYKKDELYFILGADSLLTLKHWKNSDEIINLINIIVVDRRKFNFMEVDKEIVRLNEEHDGNIKRIECPFIEISSTFIRERIKSGKSIKYLVTKEVEEYIYERNLYKGD